MTALRQSKRHFMWRERMGQARRFLGSLDPSYERQRRFNMA